MGKMKVTHVAYGSVAVHFITRNGFTVVITPYKNTGLKSIVFVSEGYCLPDAIKQRLALEEQSRSPFGVSVYRSERLTPEEVIQVFKTNDLFEIV